MVSSIFQIGRRSGVSSGAGGAASAGDVILATTVSDAGTTRGWLIMAGNAVRHGRWKQHGHNRATPCNDWAAHRGMATGGSYQASEWGSQGSASGQERDAAGPAP